MKKDIQERKATGIAIALIPTDEFAWDVYLLNLKEEAITNVIINCKGFGTRNGEAVQTSQMRYIVENIAPQTAKQIEPIPVELFDLSHQYWISFFDNNGLFDKKYILEANSFTEDRFTEIALLNAKGIFIE